MSKSSFTGLVGELGRALLQDLVVELGGVSRQPVECPSERTLGTLGLGALVGFFLTWLHSRK